jgi:carboxyl-terminal processing protease
MRTICLISLLICALCAGAQQGNTEKLRQKTITLYRFLEKNHYQPVKWNDTASAQLYTKWMDELDDEKMFFMQSDLNLLETYRTKLDDELAGKSWEFYNRSTGLYKAALQRADTIIGSILSKPLDLSKPDNIVWPCPGYAANPAELSLRWQKFLKWRVLESIATRLTETGKQVTEQLPADFAKLEAAAREKVKKREQLYISSILKTPQLFAAAMEDEYLNAIAWCYDPHTTYMNMAEKMHGGAGSFIQAIFWFQ